MLAQRLRHRVRIDDVAITTGARNAKVEGWAMWLEHEPAEIYALSGHEVVTSNNEFGRVTHRITIRHRPGLLPRMRIVDETDGTVYNVKALLPDFKLRQWYTILCESGLNNG
jgi:head-tail adaptor